MIRLARLTPLLFALVALVPHLAAAQGAREVSYQAQAIVPLRAKVRFTTLVILPEQEEILDFICGDKEFWIVSGGQNLAYIKPAKAGVSTNLNLVTAAGRIYSFQLTEGGGEPDLKVFVTPEEAFGARATTAPRFFTAAQVEALEHDVDVAQRDADDARAQLDAARAEAADTIETHVNAARAALPGALRFPYRFKAHTKPFFVSAIFTDGRFTYLRSEGTELPALYELLGTAPTFVPNLVPFQVEQGLYIVPKVLDRGYLALGTQKLEFAAVR